ncbi:MAG: methyltransferase domain-containing protein [bacterium]
MNRHCPVCGGTFANFLPIPEAYVRHQHALRVPFSLADFETLNLAEYLCPECGAQDRDRLYALYVRRWVESRGGAPLRILDIAPARALRRWLRRLPKARYRSGDLDPALADECVDVTDLSRFEDGSFDLILCSHVLEHVPEARLAMRELRRVLAPGGRAILMVPVLTTRTSTDEDPTVTDVDERWRRFGQDDHVRMYARADWLARLRESGWTIEEWGQAAFGAERLRTHGVSERSVLYVGVAEAA